MLKSRRAVQTVIGEICLLYLPNMKKTETKGVTAHEKMKRAVIDCAWKKGIMCWNACVTTVAGD